MNTQTKKMTIAEKKAWVISMLDARPRNVELAVLAIYQRQTAAEKNVGQTREDNGVGFSGTDGEFGTSLAKAITKYGSLTPKQAVYARKIIGKYWRQLIEVAEAKGTMPGSTRTVNTAPVAAPVAATPEVVVVGKIDLSGITMTECRDEDGHDGEGCTCVSVAQLGFGPRGSS